MTTDLKTLLQKCTPLPWPDDGFEMTPNANATHAELDRDDWILARHAVNTRAALVEAAREFYNDYVEFDRHTDAAARMQAALAAAETVTTEEL